MSERLAAAALFGAARAVQALKGNAASLENLRTCADAYQIEMENAPLTFAIAWDGADTEHDTLEDAERELADYCLSEMSNDRIAIIDSAGKAYAYVVTVKLLPVEND